MCSGTGLTNPRQFWDEIKGPDGIVRQLQWTARVEGNDAFTTSKSESGILPALTGVLLMQVQ